MSLPFYNGNCFTINCSANSANWQKEYLILGRKNGQNKYVLIMNYVKENYRDNPSSDKIRKDLKLGPKSITFFRERYGSTPKRLVQKYRLNDVAQLLKETNFSVAQIAEMLSFKSEQELCQQFYGKFSYSPAEFRRQVRGER